MWSDEAVIYQIYPLGACGAPEENDGKLEHRILRVLDWIEHIQKLGCTAVLFGPVFDSDRHGYDTRDYFHIDPAWAPTRTSPRCVMPSTPRGCG